MTTKTKPTATTAPVAPPSTKPSKSVLVLKLLGRVKGATIAKMGAPTGWQPHSTRAYLSDLRKKGLCVVREQRKTGETAYRIVDTTNPLVAALPAPVTSASSPLRGLSEADKRVCEGASGGEHLNGNAGVEANADVPALISTAGA